MSIASNFIYINRFQDSIIYSYKQCLVFHLLLTRYNTYKEVLYMQYIPLSYSIISIKLAADFYFFFNHSIPHPPPTLLINLIDFA
jgi:hypothetical protein